MGFYCNCANPDCMANGCVRARNPLGVSWTGNYTFTPSPPSTLTGDDIRRIIREELDKRG